MAVVITTSDVLECESMLNCHEKLSGDHDGLKSSLIRSCLLVVNALTASRIPFASGVCN